MASCWQANRRAGRYEAVALEADRALRELEAGVDRLQARERCAAVAQRLGRIHGLQTAAGDDEQHESTERHGSDNASHLTSISPASGPFVTLGLNRRGRRRLER